MLIHFLFPIFIVLMITSLTRIISIQTFGIRFPDQHETLGLPLFTLLCKHLDRITILVTGQNTFLVLENTKIR